MDRLVRYSWPGNVRELQNVVERAVILARSPTIEIDDQFLMPPSARAEMENTDNLQELERQRILQVLDRTQWRIYGPNGAADQLGLNPSTLRSRLKKLDLKRPTHFSSM
jgi:formate hydrogenlyase transcriptional activator